MLPETSTTALVATLAYTDASGPHTVELTRETTTLGRSPNQSIVLFEASVSRQHASILFSGGAFEVQDLGSTHGTFLNGQRVERSNLSPGDTLQLGSPKALRLVFDLQPRGGAAARPPHSMPDLLTSLSGIRAPSTAAGAAAAHGMEQLNFLLSAARQLNAGGALDDILRALLQLTLQLTGVERGYAFLADDTQPDPTQPGGLRLALGLDAKGNTLEEDSTISHNAIRSALQSDRKFSISDTLSDDGAAGWQSVMANQIRSIYCIPLRKLGSPQDPHRLLGLLYLDSQFTSGGLDEVDHQLLDAIAREAAGLVHNVLLAHAESTARKAREELAIAAQIHQGLMQIELPVMPYAMLSARSVACLGIGGDFFDAVAVDDWVTLTIADVSGKGVSAAIVGATLQGIIHAQLLGRQSLTEIAALLNRFLCSRNVGKYVTFVMVKLFASGQVEYMNCGHVPPLLLSGETSHPLTEHNTVAGLIPFAAYESASLTLSPGDRILLMTDGVTEAENPEGDMFGVEGLIALGPANSFDQLFDAVTRFQNGTEAVDDCTMVELHYTGAAAQAAA
jgi:sigma-B regulation protein RsbU (phosphoserine phosphatase)